MSDKLDKPKDMFSIEEQWQFYIKKTLMDETQMGEIQRIETKRAFMAGLAQMYVIMVVDIGQVNEAEELEGIQRLGIEIAEYFRKESIKDNPNIN